MKTHEELKRLEAILKKSPLPRSRGEWKGAKVVISQTARPKSAKGGFYPAPRYVVTEHSLELSWLFKKLMDAFYAEKKLDSCTKIEFFGRLANAATRTIKDSEHSTAQHLLTAVLQEAFMIYNEMEAGTFCSLSIASGNEIFNDYVKQAK